MNAFTHVNTKTFGVSGEQATKLAEQALQVFDQLFTLMKERRESTRDAAAGMAEKALRDVLYGEVNEELDRLSTHTSAEAVELYNLAIASMDHECIRYAGRGNVRARLQYGSNSDLARDDGHVSFANYPLSCEFVADTCRPLEITVVVGTLSVDTESFYEPVDDDLNEEHHLKISA